MTLQNVVQSTKNKENIVCQGILHQVVQQSVQIGDKEKIFERAERAPGTRLIIVDEAGEKLLLSREWRTEQRSYDFRLPGGKVFDSLAAYNEFRSSESNIEDIAAEAAKKEGREEVGIDIIDMKLLGVRPCGATIGWDLYYFLVNKFLPLEVGQQLEDGEDITTQWHEVEGVIKMCLSGEMKEDRSVAVLLQYLHSIRKI